MPNYKNINSPITLFAYGRSGTSVLARAFARHPEIDVIGETANLIFSPWRTLDQVKGLTRFDDNDAEEVGVELAHQYFLKMFSSSQKYWMQKPIGTPAALWEFGLGKVDVFIDWYWRAFNKIFPQSRSFSIIRHPNDVFISAREYWKFSDEHIWQTQAVMLKILMHPAANLRTVLRYEDLSANPESSMKALTAALDIPYHERMVTVFSALHAPTTKQRFGSEAEWRAKHDKGFSRNEEWANKIVDSPLARSALDTYRAAIKHFGLEPATTA